MGAPRLSDCKHASLAGRVLLDGMSRSAATGRAVLALKPKRDELLGHVGYWSPAFNDPSPICPSRGMLDARHFASDGPIETCRHW